MYALAVRIRSARGLVSLAAYRALLAEIRSLLIEVDLQALSEPGAGAVEWAVRHEQAASGMTLRVEPFDVNVDQQRVMRVARAVVGGVHELAAGPVIPAYYTDEAVGDLARVAGRRGASGIDRLDLAAVNGQVLDEAEVSEAVRLNASSSVKPATVEMGSVEGIVDALGGGARSRRRATVYDPSTRRAVRVRLGPDQADVFRDAWGSRVAVRGLITYNGSGQPIRIDAAQVLQLSSGAPRQQLGELIGAGKAWIGGRSVDEAMRELRRRA